MNELTILENQTIQDKIYTIRGVQVMLDEDLASLYGVETKVFNQAVKRNVERFPEKFRFQLSESEYENLRLQIVTSSLDDSLRSQIVTLESQRGKHRKYLPYVFTEQGISMLSAVLRSQTAIEVSIKIIDLFVQMRNFLQHNASLFTRLETIEKRQISYEMKTDSKIDLVLNALEDKNKTPSQGIFYNGQIYDAYAFANDLLKSAKNEVMLIDNYIDDTIFTLCSKYQNINFTIYTMTINKQLKLDYEKYKKQYKNIELKETKDFHDRFLIIDNSEIYHIGASIKDLGNKVFAFSKLNIDLLNIMEKIS
ncbi:MAG: ORF6N domain-containing protein [Campylobacterota bacterium]|nr:ORF6N domain-containing protein [Campylobacterota bacterium]